MRYSVPTRRATLATIAAALGGCTAAPGRQTGRQSAATPPSTDISGSWTHLDANAGGTLATGTQPLDAAPAEAWLVDFESGYRPLRLAGDRLYTAAGTSLVRRSLADGSVVWERSFDRTVRLTAAVDDRLYVTTGENDPTLYALAIDEEGATVEWSREGLRGRRATPDLVVATTDDNSRLVALDPDGTQRWSITPPEIVDVADRFGPVVVANGFVYPVVECDAIRSWVAGLERGTGNVSWFAEDPNQNTVLAAGPDVVVSAGGEAGATGFSPDGNTLWEVETDGAVQTAAVADGRVFLGDESETVTALTEQGDPLWTREDLGLLSADAGAVYAVGEQVQALDAETGETRRQLGTTPELLVPASGGLFTLRSVSGATELRLYA